MSGTGRVRSSGCALGQPARTGGPCVVDSGRSGSSWTRSTRSSRAPPCPTPQDKEPNAGNGCLSKSVSEMSLASSATGGLNERDNTFSMRTVTGVLASRPTARCGPRSLVPPQQPAPRHLMQQPLLMHPQQPLPVNAAALRAAAAPTAPVTPRRCVQQPPHSLGCPAGSGPPPQAPRPCQPGPAPLAPAGTSRSSASPWV